MSLSLLLNGVLEQYANTVCARALVQTAQNLSRAYRDETAKTTRSAMTTDNDATAYALSRMPATFGAVKHALAHLKQATGTTFSTLADIGAGTGAATWAAFDTFPELTSAVCLEREPRVANLGKTLMTEAPFFARTAWKAFDLTKDDLPRADLIVCSYVLNELPDATRRDAVRRLWEATGKALVITDPATPLSFQKIIETRQTLIDADAFIAAPCPHERACPLTDDGWCHFSCRIARTKMHKLLKRGDAPFEDEKFVYLAAVRSCPEHRPARVLRHPVTRSGCVDLTLCLSDGTTCKKTASRRDKIFYKAAKKADWGDTISF